MEPNAMTINDHFAIVKRRKWSLILPALIVFLCAAIVALSLPSIYKSTSTILIEEQDIPADFVMTTVTSFAEQRLQSIYQKIVSFSRLLDIVNRFNLYPDLKEKWTTEKIVEKMREDILLKPISAEMMDRRTGRSTAATIAFTLSYEGESPGTVQQVAGMLTSLFLEENLRVRERQTTETTEFLEDEMEKVKADLAELEAEMAVFKESHINELPDLLQVNMQSLNNIENNIERFNEQIRSLKEKEGYLQTQLASIPATFEVENEVEKSNKERLAELKAQLVYFKGLFSDKYPDVIKTKAQIAEIEKKVNHPAGKSDNPGHSDGPPDNPAYITLAAQLSNAQADILSVKRQIEESYAAADMYRRRLANTPKVEEAYRAISIERNNTQAKYDDLMRKHMEAKVAQGLE
ncbi:MAG: Wzz/FepE/Etk N-terminal domain-containing protein, partial [Anaerolineales bacterium]